MLIMRFSLVVMAFVQVALAKQALNFMYFEKEDKNRDGKLTIQQFVDGMLNSVKKGVRIR